MATGISDDMIMMYVIHDALRRDLEHLTRAVESRASLEPDRRQAFDAGWELFKLQLHHHHTGEDTALWPMVQQKSLGLRGAGEFFPYILSRAGPERGSQALAQFRPASIPDPPGLAAPLRQARALELIRAVRISDPGAPSAGRLSVTDRSAVEQRQSDGAAWGRSRSIRLSTS